MILKYLLIFVMVLTFASCGPVPLERLGLVNLSVSAEQRSARSFSTNDRSIRATAITDDQYFKEERKVANRGSRLYQLTPESFILDIDNIVVYKKNGSEDYLIHELMQKTTNPYGAIIPQHYDLVHAKGITRDALVQNSIYNGLSISFLPGGRFGSNGLLSSTTNDGFYVLSSAGIELPTEYDDVTLDGEFQGIEGLHSGLRYFSFKSLQPIEINNGNLKYLTIGSDNTENWVQNPNGEFGEWVSPLISTTGNSVALYLASDSSIDVSAYKNPELLLNWDMQDLVEIWDNGTPSDLRDDIVTFKVSDPFPVSLVIREKSIKKGASSDITAPSNVNIAAIAGQNTMNTLQWINPQDEDFKEVSIIRKAGGAPSDPTDGEEVYRGHIPNYVDVSGISGTHYYYLIQTVDYSGNYSSGVVLDQVQP